MADGKVSEDSINTSGADDAAAEESFAALLEGNGFFPERLVPGQRIKSKVVSISGGTVYVDLGGKSEGVIDLSEFMDDGGSCCIREGDEVEAFFMSVRDGVRKLTTLMHGHPLFKLEALRNAHLSGTPVNGLVKSGVKGGYEVSLDGINGFCPFSQIDIRSKNSDAADYIGQTLQFKVLEFKGEGRNIVVSRRVLLENERAERIERLRETLKTGMDVTAPVRSVHKFGAFVDLGGIDGMIPVSEMSWDRINKPQDILSPGMEISARLISLDWEGSRITLSIKAMHPDPWQSAAEKYAEGSRVSGKIVRMAPFGVFVNLEPGIDGLIHISNLGAGRRINHPKEVVATGQQVEAYILEVDPQSRKISLSMQPRPEPKKTVYPAEGELIEGNAEKVMPFGIFVKMDNGLTGLVPNSETGIPAGTDLGRMFPAGTPVKAVVLEVDPARSRVSLSISKVKDREEREDFKRYRDSIEKGSSDGLSRLGELLKAKMQEKESAV